MRQPWSIAAGQHVQAWSSSRDDGAERKLILYLPDDYDATAPKKWPLIIFLHGSGERGVDISLVEKHGPPKIFKANGDSPFIVASPQLPENATWSSDFVNALLDELIVRLNVDIDRVYLTGLSLGGHGTWSAAAKSPERFAAIAPICGRGNIKNACALKNVPIWAFHGDIDPVVLIGDQRNMVEAVNACGGQARFTVYPGVGHDAWTSTYENPELYAWFLQHRRLGVQP